MPTIVNGIGTWYCGKRRIHRVKTACPHCGAFAELESYDTTLCFVVFMVPLVPLSERRILQNCPACQRHRVVKLKDWEAGKSQAFNTVLEKLQANPDDRETIQAALGLATVYQDERLFDKLADVLVGHRTDDAEIQAQLGAAYEYFSRWPDAEAAYRRSLAVEPSDDTRERLAVCLLKQGRPEEAADNVRHVFESKDPEKAWLVFWLVEGFMARGMHDEALRVMDVRDELYPKLARTKDYQRQRRTAEKNLKSGKPVKSAYLAESAKTGFREGSKLGFKWPKYVAAAIVLGLLALYLGVAIYRGQNRPVYLVNGWTKPYTVKVNGQEHQLQPGAHQKIDVPEGDVTVDWPDGGDGPQTVRVETSFWGRPFQHPVFVINPDRLAILERDETVYSAEPVNPDHPPEYHAGEVLHRFQPVDYEFEPFPPQIQAKAGSRITKTRVGLIPVTDTQTRVFQAMTALPQDKWPAYVKRVVQLDPNDTFALTFLTSTLPPAEAIDFLRPGLALRPVRVEWHRIYQYLVEVVDPTKDLRPEYRKLIDETKRAPDAVYLLARLEDGPEADKLYTEAASANPPSGQACAGLSYRHLARGEFADAVRWATKAHDLNPSDLAVRQRYLLALLAAERWADLLKATDQRTPADGFLHLRYRLTAHVASGEAGAAEGEVNRAAAGPRGMNLAPQAAQMAAQMRLSLEQTLAEVKRDRAKYLELAGRMPGSNKFAVSLLRGDPKAAAAAAAAEDHGPVTPNAARNWELEAERAGLLYLAGLKAKDAAFADAQWKRFAAALARGDREARLYAAFAEGKKPVDVARAKSATITPSLKRVVLAALARKFPEHAKDLDPLSKKLDFERDEISLCLRYVME
jgi:tetratricopeptide (TPR) repeat protein